MTTVYACVMLKQRIFPRKHAWRIVVRALDLRLEVTGSIPAAALSSATLDKLFQSWTWIGSIHGLDWVGLDWIGLGQDFEETLWIGLDWVR